jgi:hypothetical protein
VVGAFPQVTTDFGSVIRQVNERFGTSFIEFVHDDRNQRAIFDAMEAYWRSRVGPGSELERRVGRPSAERDRVKAALLPEFLAPELGKLRRETHALYAAFTS